MAKARTLKGVAGCCFLLILSLGMLSGCASRMPVPVIERRAPIDGSTAPPPMDMTTPLPTRAPKTAAVAGLLKDVQSQVAAGDFEAAAQTLERTLRIEPKNPLLWSELANVRFRQGQIDQAEQLATKSNSLAVEDIPLQVYNWRLIANARRQRGDIIEAGDAERRAWELKSQ